MASIEPETPATSDLKLEEKSSIIDHTIASIPLETTTTPNDVLPASLPDIPAVPPLPADAVKKPPAAKKANAESKEGPMGELRPTDILAGNYRKRAGNYLYKKLLRELAPDVGKVEMRILVGKVVEGIANQIPPGRFIREGGDALLSAAQRNQKIARALREVAERATKEEGETKTDKTAKKPKVETEKHQEPIGEIRPSDVLTGNYRKRAGNYLYKKLLRDEAPNVAKEEMRTVVNRVIEGIYGQFPPGRFIREGGGGLLTRGQIHQKVARALREVVERSGKEVDEKDPGEKVVKKKTSSIDKQEPMGEIRPTDVLTGNYRKRAGNALYKKLLRDHAPSVGREEMSAVVTRVVEGIAGQNPPGRFIREGGGALLTRGQVRQKVARALREVVERSKAEKDALLVVEGAKVEQVVPKPDEEVKVEEEKIEADIPIANEELVEEGKEEVDAPEEPKKKRGKKDEEPKEEEEKPIEEPKGKKAKKEEEPKEEEGKTRKSRRGAETKEEVKPPAKRTRKK